MSDLTNTVALQPTKTNDKQAVPRWLPVSLLAVTTAALAVPLVYVRRQYLALKLARSAPPPRRTGGPAPPPTRSSTSSGPQVRARQKSTQNAPSSRTLHENASYEEGEGTPVSPLMALRAFGIATAIVGGGVGASVWGVKEYLGVRDVPEFVHAMRTTLVSRLPRASAFHPNEAESTEWTWDDAAEERLKAAYDEGGLEGWAEAIEREERAEGSVVGFGERGRVGGR